VDVLGLVLGCDVTAANVADVKAAPGVLVWVVQMDGRIVKVLADKGYRGDLGVLLTHFLLKPDGKLNWRLANVQIMQKDFS
jgi:hypothetical protein